MLVMFSTFTEDSNNKELFEKLFYLYRKQMLFLAITIVHNQEDAEDIVHDVFLNIAQRHMRNLKRIENDEDIRNYLLKATKNKALNKIRNQKKVIKDLSEISELQSSAISDKDFIDTICKKSQYEQILSAINSLDDIYRNSLYYHFVLDLPINQVAKTLHQSVPTTKKQLVRGKKLLLKLIESKGE